jgi:hypothetical protein
MEPSRKRHCVGTDESSSSYQTQPDDDVLPESQRRARNIVLRLGYISGGEILKVCLVPLLSGVSDNPENWAGRTLVFELQSEADLVRLEHLYSRYLSTDRKLGPPKVPVHIELAIGGNRWLQDEMLGRVAVFGKLLQSLDLRWSRGITDSMAYLAGLTSLRSLNLGGCIGITDGGVAPLRQLPALNNLNLDGCRVTNDSMELLSKLKYLRVLNLGGCWAINENGMDHLTGLKYLKSLSLRLCQLFTDVGVAKLAGLKAWISAGARHSRMAVWRFLPNYIP